MTVLAREAEDPARWGACLLVVLAVHLASAWWLQHPVPADATASLPPAVLMELPAPEPIAPAPAPPPPAAPPPQAQVAPPEPEAPPVVPTPPPTVVPEVTLPKPPPRPKPRPKAPAPPKPLPAEPAPEIASSPAPPAPAQATTPAAAAPAAPPASVVNGWTAQLVDHIRRHRHFPPGAQDRGEHGTTLVWFRFDRAGRVLAAAVRGGSGHADLDQAALDDINRMPPLPPPPPEIPGEVFQRVIPLPFLMR